MITAQPILLSAIACDRVIFDRVSGMPSVINIIQNINAAKYPARHSQLVFFCELTNGHGKTTIDIKLVDVQEDERVVSQQQGGVEFKDVRQVVTLAMNLQGLVFPHPGEYRFQLFAAKILLGERKIVCRQVQLPPQKGNTENQ